MESKLTLKQMILNVIDGSPRGYSEELAKIAGYSNGSNLKKVLRDEKKDFDNFNGIVELVRYLFGEDEQKLMEQYSKTLDPNNKSARYMLEYLSCNRLLDSMKELIERMLVCKNKESIEWARIYSMQYEWQANYHELDMKEFKQKLNETKTDIKELNIVLKFLKINSFYKKRMFKMSLEVSHIIKDLLNDVKDNYIKSAYTMKYNEILSYLSLRVYNKPEEARKYAEIVLDLNIGKTFNAYALYIKGCSYFYTSYDKAKENFEQSINTYETINRTQAANDVREISELLDIVWDKEITEVQFSKEYKYLWIVKNGESIDITNEELDEPFAYMINGIMKNDTTQLMQSLISFVKRGDVFLSNLAKIELLKNGYNDIIINDIMKLHSA